MDNGAAPAGWYPDSNGTRRYWNGQTWTDRTMETGPAGAVYAGFWMRFLGLLLDSVIIAVALTPITLFAIWPVISDPYAAPSPEDTAGPLLLLVLSSLILTAAYFVVGLHKFGRTIGGQVVGIRCVDENGQYPSWTASLIRQGVVAGFGLFQQIPGIGILGLPLSLVNYLWMLWDPKKQCGMDKAAGTYVVKADSLQTAA